MKDGKEAKKETFKREYRALALSAEDEQKNSYIVHGHASTFEPYEVYNDGTVSYQERVSRGAYDACDMSDLVFRADHNGPVYARSSAGTLSVSVDDKGLYFEADLSRTTKSKEMYEEIRAGNYPQASFAFVVEADHYEAATHTRVIDAIRKIYDVGPATWAINRTTDIEAQASARSYFAAQEEYVSKIAAGKKRKALLLKMRAAKLTEKK